MSRQILVTSALPYANGSIHLGHLVEYIQTDIWVRFQKMRGHDCRYMCADDTHGTAIMLRAEKEGITPETLIGRVWDEHTRDFAGFNIGFDHYYSTHSDENRELASKIYLRLKEAGLIEVKTIAQLYDPVKNLFLPDRFIKGECPKCGALDQYGDNCEVCGATYSPTELKNPVSAVSGATPVHKDSEHYFFKLGDCEAFLREWTNSGALQSEAANKMKEWFASGLNNWDISRDAPYFGFEIPGAPGKYFYVWLDAPVGYMASFARYAADNGLDFDAWWGADSKTELVHFIGKDILYFHALFWPAMLKYSGHRLPTAVYAHGFLTVNGAEDVEVARHLHHRRKLPRAEAESRVAALLLRRQAQRLDGGHRPESRRFRRAGEFGSGRQVRQHRQPHRRLHPQELRRQARRRRGQHRTDRRLPGRRRARSPRITRRATTPRRCARSWRWPTAPTSTWPTKNPGNWRRNPKRSIDLHEVCTVALNCFRLLTLYLKPVLPKLAGEVEAFLNIPPLAWEDSQSLFIRHRINEYSHLMTRIDPKSIEAMVDANKQNLEAHAAPCAGAPRRSAGARRAAGGRRAGVRNDQHRRLQQDRPAHRAHRRGRSTSKAPTSCCG